MIDCYSHEVATASSRGRQPTDKRRFDPEPRKGDSNRAPVSLSPLRGCGLFSFNARGLTPTAKRCRHSVAKIGGQR